MTTRTFIIFPILVAGAAWLLYSEALLAAVVFNMTRFIPSLLESGYHVNGQNILGWPLLHIAAMNKNPEIVKLLVQAGADLDTTDTMGFAALNVAVAKRDIGIARYLISEGASLAPEGGLPYTSLYTAIYSGDADMVEFLIDSGADVNSRATRLVTPLSEGLMRNISIDIVQLLVENGADINAVDEMGRGVLHHCVAFSSPEIAEYLISKGCDINAADEEGKTAFFYAAGVGDERGRALLELFYKNGANINTAVTKIVYNEQPHPTNPEMFNEIGSTPLHHAALTRNTNAIDFLLEKGASINARNEEGVTPLLQSFVSAYGATNDVAVLLIKAGADVTIATSKKRWTALHMAAGNNDFVVADLILSSPTADSDELLAALTSKGETPLDWAMDIRHEAMAKHLISKGAKNGNM